MQINSLLNPLDSTIANRPQHPTTSALRTFLGRFSGFGDTLRLRVPEHWSNSHKIQLQGDSMRKRKTNLTQTAHSEA